MRLPDTMPMSQVSPPMSVPASRVTVGKIALRGERGQRARARRRSRLISPPSWSSARRAIASTASVMAATPPASRRRGRPRFRDAWPPLRPPLRRVRPEGPGLPSACVRSVVARRWRGTCPPCRGQRRNACRQFAGDAAVQGRRPLPGSETTVGWPASVCSRIASVSGRLPSQGVPYCSAMRRPPPSPKMCSAWPHCEQMWMAMFSTTPRMGTSTFWNMRRPLRASSSATSWAW